MARRLSRREYTLLGMLALVALAVLWLHGDRGRGAADSSAGAIADLIVGDAPVVHMDRLATTVEGYDPRGRNLFRYYTPPPPTPVKTEGPHPPPRPVAPPVRPVAPRPAAPTVSGPRMPTPPPIDFTYLGFLGPKNDKIAVFEDGEELLLARAGDVVREQFRVVDFGFETIVIGYTDERFKGRTAELKQKKGR